MKYVDELSCHEAIRSIRPDAYNIVTPKVLGGVNTVFISDTANGKFVFRFSSEEAAKRNEVVSSILIDHEIPVPSITAHHFKDIYFEVYPYQLDIYSKNVLVDDNDNFSAILDLDSIAPNYETSALTRMAHDSKELGYKFNRVYKIYAGLHENQLTKFRINCQMMVHSNYRNIIHLMQGKGERQ